MRLSDKLNIQQTGTLQTKDVVIFPRIPSESKAMVTKREYLVAIGRHSQRLMSHSKPLDSAPCSWSGVSMVTAHGGRGGGLLMLLS